MARTADNRVFWLIPALLTAGTLCGLLGATPLPLDDHFLYQRFIETLAAGRLDLSIPGFHGSDFFAVPLHLLTRSPVSQIHFQILCAALLPLAGFAAGRSLFQSRTAGLMLSAIVALLPFVSFAGLRGWTGPAYWLLMMGCLALIRSRPVAAGTLLAFAILTKPFAVALLPLLWIHLPRGKSLRRSTPLIVALGISALYVLLQFLQTGTVAVGAHPDVSPVSVWQSPLRVFLNAAHGLQILFSVHNYYFPDPSLTGPGNMMHTTPVLVFLGLFGLLCQPDLYAKGMRRALLTGALIGLGLNTLLDHMDHFYMEAGILCLLLAAVPVLLRFPVWIPLVLATLHFQWFYFFLEYGDAFRLGSAFFLVPAMIDLLFAGFCVLRRRETIRILQSLFS